MSNPSDRTSNAQETSATPPTQPPLPDAQNRTPLGLLYFPQGILRAEWGQEGLVWEVDGYTRSGNARSVMGDHAWYANLLSTPPYGDYSPADGLPGYALAEDVSRQLDGRWEPLEPDAELVTDELILEN